ncbi:xanthine dehydrogenase family protein molybdopterin-binding subunit [Pendulispora rubella]|uniref:Xanthine dehydrogenase family protein molybdopterin-binding subunit n=1 Tax=Pendulispora rubella TaxID=2741070 RepID=A0ABZ2LLA3_9BACT
MSSPSIVIPRRSFLAALGLSVGTLAVGLGRPPSDAHAAAVSPPDGGFTPNVFVHIAPDGTVTVCCHRSEMGQGIRSSIPVLVADELGADMAKVKLVQADGDKKYGDQNTDGSTSVRNGFDNTRRVGATARMMLIAAAAKQWKVPAAQCEAHDHAVFHTASKRRLGFGELAPLAAKLPVPKEADVVLRPKSELRHVGTALPLLDGPDIVTGRAIYAADVRLPGMLTAVVARPPVVGGKVDRYDAARARALPGVKRVFELPVPKRPFRFQPLGGIAVVADNTWTALRARSLLDITWAPGDNASYDSAKYRETLLASVRKPGKTMRNVGDVEGALAKAARKIEAEYHVPHLAHASMEPPAAVARVDEKGCEVWACTQDPQTARDDVAKALGLDLAKVTIHVTLLGGGFGRKSKPDFIVEAALVSRAVGAPVRLQWTREDDIQHDYYHSTCTQHLEAGLDAQGKVTGWLHRTAFPSILSTVQDANITFGQARELNQGVLDWPLAVPNLRAEVCEAKGHVRIGWLRSVHNINHAFAINSFIDEIAHARGVDPRANLLDMIGPARPLGLSELGVPSLSNYGSSLEQHPVDASRLRRVVERVTELAHWSAYQKDAQSGSKTRALGLAAHRSFVSYIAVVAAVVKSPDGKIRVDEAWIVADAGTVIHLDRVKAQMEGAIVFAMSLTLHGAITMRDGAVQQSNFRDYRLARIGEVPRNIHVDILPSEGRPGGVGEPGVPPVAPAIANAVFALTGKRIRELPLSRSGLV